MQQTDNIMIFKEKLVAIVDKELHEKITNIEDSSKGCDNLVFIVTLEQVIVQHFQPDLKFE